MFDLKKVKGIIFDYGGTIDSNGKHWAEVIWEAYVNHQVPVTKQQFREAWVHVERYLAVNPVIKPEHHFGELLNIKVNLQLDFLTSEGYLKDNIDTKAKGIAIAKESYTFAKNTISKEKSILETLKSKYPMVLVSNFYGNVQAVLADFDLLKYFDDIIESAVVGVRKPDPAIFGLGVDKLGLPSSEIVVIGDSYSKDIVPATKNGCQTIWLQGPGWGDDEEGATADLIITDFMELKAAFQLD